MLGRLISVRLIRYVNRRVSLDEAARSVSSIDGFFVCHVCLRLAGGPDDSADASTHDSRHSHAQANADAYATPNPNTNTNADTLTDSHSNANAIPDANRDADTNSHARAWSTTAKGQ